MLTNPNPAAAAAEPRPGEWLAPEDFANVIRLTPLVAIDLIVRSPEGRVLVGRRNQQPARGTLFVPGSRISKNETLAAAFERITRDELGISVSIRQGHFLGVYEHIYPSNRFERPGFGTHYIVLAYELTLALEAATLPTDQHEAYCWLRPDELVHSREVHENTKAYFRNR